MHSLGYMQQLKELEKITLRSHKRAKEIIDKAKSIALQILKSKLPDNADSALRDILPKRTITISDFSGAGLVTFHYFSVSVSVCLLAGFLFFGFVSQNFFSLAACRCFSELLDALRFADLILALVQLRTMSAWYFQTRCPKAVH